MIFVHTQPRSQGLSSYRPLEGGKMRDTGNEVGPHGPPLLAISSPMPRIRIWPIRDNTMLVD